MMPNSLPKHYQQCFDKHRKIWCELMSLQTKLGKFSRVSILLSSLMKNCQVWSANLLIHTIFFVLIRTLLITCRQGTWYNFYISVVFSDNKTHRPEEELACFFLHGSFLWDNNIR